MDIDDLLHDRQPKAGTGFLRGKIGLEYFCKIFRRDAVARVRDVKADETIFGRDLDVHIPAVAADRLYRIYKEVVEYRPEIFGISHYHRYVLALDHTDLYIVFRGLRLYQP